MTSPSKTKKTMGSLVLASSVGTVIEWYDFFLYGTLAVFFSRLFYPPGNEVASMLISVAIFATGFAVRPLGSLFFGYMGDSVGRKKTFLITLLIMGLSTACIGFLPTYASAGYAAPILLVILRIIQGLALGGEYGGAATYVVEHSPPDERGKWAGCIQAMASGGFVLSLIVVLTLRISLGEEAFGAWGWRIPFLISALLVVVSVRLRLKLSESPVFAEMHEQGKLSKSPVRDAFRIPGNARRIFLFTVGVACAQAVTFYTAQFYALYYIQTFMKVAFLPATLSVAAGACLGVPFFIFAGSLSDKIGRKGLSLAGMATAFVLYIPVFYIIRHSIHDGGMNYLVIALSVFVLVVVASAIYGPYGAFIVESFPASVRYTSISIPYHIGNGIFGGFLPVISLWLVAKTGNPYAGLFYPMALCLIGFVITLFCVPETLVVSKNNKNSGVVSLAHDAA